MGNICFGTKEESKKASAFQATDNGIVERDQSAVEQENASSTPEGPNSSLLQHPPQVPPPTLAEQKEENERLKALREEQARLELIVQATGRSMVAVRSTRGSTGYYDQGFGAALSQHLEQTTQFPSLSTVIPPSHSDTVYSRLAQPQWQNIQLGNKDGLAGCAGENPNTYLDHVAESYLDSVIPKKERLFTGAGPIVENLL